ncbi:MAG: hypothetical protein KDK30_08400 [Leptospiraceae bacterium]|nr:hypothetical protein [Leptospiraceae bacterium]MCB1316741.1 hypothetical protein [Leptospiraceae bacterium]
MHIIYTGESLAVRTIFDSRRRTGVRMRALVSVGIRHATGMEFTTGESDQEQKKAQAGQPDRLMRQG